MYCKNCGQQINDNAVVCPHCGCAQKPIQTVDDDGSIGWGLLGCCIPIVGLVLFLVWKDTKPNSAKAAGIGALVSVVGIVIYYILIFALGLGAALL